MVYNTQNHWISGLVFSTYLEFQTLNEVQKPGDSDPTNIVKRKLLNLENILGLYVKSP
jgi:hypothetical protein